jgi:hypothetical protein
MVKFWHRAAEFIFPKPYYQAKAAVMKNNVSSEEK